MHKIQEKILKLAGEVDLYDLTLREIGKRIGEGDSPQKIKHHLNQLARKGFIRIDKKKKRIERVGAGAESSGKVVSLPIMGDANCGEATCLAEDYVEGYLHLSRGVLRNLSRKKDNLFVLWAVGSSMNKAIIDNQRLEDGDYVLVNRDKKKPSDRDYVASIIDGVANIKKFYKKDDYIILVSESTHNVPPIYIHKDDIDDYLVAGIVVKVLKRPDELKELERVAGDDMQKEFGDMSKEENNYYKNL
jgi:SOS-response transcriptional repressor LexA